MWSFATHASAGLAVAGLSATYYALARKNVQLERDNALSEIGQDVQSDGDRRRSSSGHSISLPASQMLLKKELDFLARDSGHAFGLNVSIDNEDGHLEMTPSIYSGIDIRKIVSRVQTNFPINSRLSESANTQEEDLETSDPDDAKLEAALAESSSPTTSISSNPREDDSRNAFDVEEFSRLNMSEDEVGNNNKFNSSNKKLTSTEIPATYAQLYRNPTSEKSTMIQRKKSPIVYYKNPGFGKRFACKIQESNLQLQMPEMSSTPRGGRFHSFNIRDFNKDDKSVDSDHTYKDSTQFLFPPVLSESKLSICEDDEEQEQMTKDVDEKDFDRPIDDLDENALLTQGLSRMDEIRDYNLQLQVAQDVRNTDDDGFMGETPTFDLFETSQEEEMSIPAHSSINTNYKKDSEFEKVAELNWNFAPQTEKKDFDNNKLDLNLSEELAICNKDRESSSVMQRIPENSWISLPARLYAESNENVSVHLIIFLSLVIIVFGILGKFFIALADWFQLDRFEADDDDYNPNAMLEH